MHRDRFRTGAKTTGFGTGKREVRCTGSKLKLEGFGEMEALDYSSIVLDRFERPINAGRLHGRDVTGAAGDESLGTRVEFDFRVREGVVERGSFRAYGCPHAIAAASWVAEAAEGRRLKDTAWLNALELAKVLAVPDHKLGVLLVVEDALRNAASARAEGVRGVVSNLPGN